MEFSKITEIIDLHEVATRAPCIATAAPKFTPTSIPSQVELNSVVSLNSLASATQAKNTVTTCAPCTNTCTTHSGVTTGPKFTATSISNAINSAIGNLSIPQFRPVANVIPYSNTAHKSTSTSNPLHLDTLPISYTRELRTNFVASQAEKHTSNVQNKMISSNRPINLTIGNLSQSKITHKQTSRNDENAASSMLNSKTHTEQTSTSTKSTLNATNFMSPVRNPLLIFPWQTEAQNTLNFPTVEPINFTSTSPQVRNTRYGRNKPIARIMPYTKNYRPGKENVVFTTSAHMM